MAKYVSFTHDTSPSRLFRRRAAISGACAVAIAGAWFGCVPCLAAVGKLLVVQDPLAPADIAMVLNGGENTRPFRAAALYRAGLTPKILLAQEESISHSKYCPGCRTTDTSKRVLQLAGVPQERIFEVQTPGGVKTTFDEAQACFSYCWPRQISRVMVVTSDFHTRRAKWIFSRVFSGTGTRIMVVPTPNGRYSAENWWLRADGRHDFCNEYLKLAYYFCRYGWIIPVHETTKTIASGYEN